MVGVTNGTSPNPVRLREMCEQMGFALGRPSWLPVLEIALKVVLGEGAFVRRRRHSVESLSKQGINTYLLSGDKKNAAEYVASVVGILKENVSSFNSVKTRTSKLLVGCSLYLFACCKLQSGPNISTR
ncbi:hypothetical protein HAX54_048666 [Datura stramonium]|uniref:Uncharacterized protein n=1 Tax=Datura stramonium TaxID=4076 RepID=A0ABS8SUJ8_DATST|nr:hypothetical protein [Datura stramonium]